MKTADLREGEHTLTLGGTATNGVNIKTSLGLIITSEPQVTVDETQSNTSSGSNSLGMMTLFALVMVLLGFGGVLIGKRRKFAKSLTQSDSAE
jgi:hypothetical protein